jgi:hypothetical protein
VFALTGSLKSQAGVAIAGATVTVLDGQSKGRSATVGLDGLYRIDNVAGNMNVQGSAPGYIDQVAGASPLQTTANFTMVTVVPWSASGSGDNVVGWPAYITRIRITGSFSGSSSNFIVDCTKPSFGPLFVNELLGTSWGPTSYAGTFNTQGCTEVQIEHSSGVSWSITESR